ncbi:MAG TPA: 2-amino-4-hydroxy-6-hydroxymethyldihydropteridine diphosphokinase [Thermoanaerobaculia bacterium]
MSLGANQGDAEASLVSALRRLRRLLGPLEVASLYRTAPVGAVPQPDFLNTAVTGTTDLPPERLLAAAKAFERAAGRRAGPRHGPRPLDIDLLLYGDLTSDDPGLTLPHPGLPHRRFVLVPLAEIAPGWRVPPGGETVAGLLAATGDRSRVERVGWSQRSSTS